MKLELDNEMIEAIYEIGLTAYDNGNYEKAYNTFQKLSEAGYKDAKYKIGNMYLEGTGVNKSFEKAKEYFSELANENHTYSINNMGAICFNEANYADAIKWFEKALKNGSKEAAYNLGYIYEAGLSVNVNKKKAFKYYYEAALFGDEDAKIKANEIQKELMV